MSNALLNNVKQNASIEDNNQAYFPWVQSFTRIFCYSVTV